MQGDTFIVSAVLDYACKGEDVFLFASDTDILIMLIYFWSNLMGRIIIKSEATRRYKGIEQDVEKWPFVSVVFVVSI